MNLRALQAKTGIKSQKQRYHGLIFRVHFVFTRKFLKYAS